MLTRFKVWFTSLVMTGLLSFISVIWLDKPIAIRIHNAFGAQHISSDVADSPGLSIPTISVFVFAVLGLLAIIRRNFSKLETTVACCDISILAAEGIKNQLKYAFGRTWPDSWAPQVPSLIRDNVYGFHFFHTGQVYEFISLGPRGGDCGCVHCFMDYASEIPPNLRHMHRRRGCRTCSVEFAFCQRRHCRDVCRGFGRSVHCRSTCADFPALSVCY